MKQIDRYGRKIDYLRISVTDRCNLRCVYCMPPEGIPLISRSDVLSYEEITRIARLAYEMGFKKFRITGGEPLVRKNLPVLISCLADLGADIDLALTTNGILLAKYAEELKSAGLHRINVSLDTLKREKFKRITRFDLFPEVIKGIDSALNAGFAPVKLNVVAVRGVNDDEVLDFAHLTKDQPLWVRFIELMPFSRNNWSRENFISAEEIRKIIEAKYELIKVKKSYDAAPSSDYMLPQHVGRIGFIASLTENFCASCNRLRLTADGHIVPCLHSPIEIDIGGPMRAGASDDDLRSVLRKAVLAKPRGHRLREEAFRGIDRNMSKVGG